MPSAQELSVLPHAELAERLAEAYRLIGRLQARVEQLERRAGKDSSNSSRPPSSDSPYRKKPRDRSLRERGKRRPGKQPGDPGTTMNLVDDPDERLEFCPARCRGCTRTLDCLVTSYRAIARLVFRTYGLRRPGSSLTLPLYTRQGIPGKRKS